MADLGVHLIRKEWLLEQLRQRIDQDWRGDIWDVYEVDRPIADVLMYVPDHDPIAIDMGTGWAFHAVVSRLNARFADKNGNIAFPGAKIRRRSTETIALPASHTRIPLSKVTVPEGMVVHSMCQALQA